MDHTSSPFRFVRHLFSLSSSLCQNVTLYSLYHVTFFLTTLAATLLLDQCAKSNHVRLLLILCWVTSSLSITLRHYAFPFSNILVKNPMWKVSIQNILSSVFKTHPLWLTPSSVTGGMLRENIIDYGVGGLTKGLNRLSHLGPLFFELVVSILRMGVLNFPLTVTFITVLVSIEVFLFSPLKEKISKQRDSLLKNERQRFLVAEKLEYSTLQRNRTR